MIRQAKHVNKFRLLNFRHRHCFLLMKRPYNQLDTNNFSNIYYEKVMSIYHDDDVLIII